MMDMRESDPEISCNGYHRFFISVVAASPFSLLQTAFMLDPYGFFITLNYGFGFFSQR